MRSLALSLTLFALPAAAGTVTAQGEVRLNHGDDILNGRPLGTADWTSYCGNGQRNDTYAADGLTLHNGDIQRVRPGLYHGQNQLVRGNLARRCAARTRQLFQHERWRCRRRKHHLVLVRWAPLTAPSIRSGSPPGATAPNTSSPSTPKGACSARCAGPSPDSRFVGLETDEPIALYFYCNDDAMAGATISQGGSTVMSDTLIWGNSSNCGNGIVDEDEDCDDGNRDNDDACANSCLERACGNEHVDTNEACDDGNEVDTDGCKNDCSLAACGDGVVRDDLQAGQDGFEACDDGNQVDEDAFTSSCAQPRRRRHPARRPRPGRRRL